MTNFDQRGAIRFAEKVLELLDEGRFTATYKYAVLLALLDVCFEHTEKSGTPPDLVTTRQLAEKVIELYWPHTVPFVHSKSASVLRQNTTGQAAIISVIERFRSDHAPDATVPRWESKLRSPKPYERLVRAVEWKLIEMPLPRLQMIGQLQQRFVYEIYWDQRIERAEVARYQAGESSSFDNRVMFRPNVGEYLVQLNGLLRPLIQRRWAAMVAQVNRLEESQLDAFLFGVNRTPTAKIRAGLWEIQERRCFYCSSRIVEPVHAEVDHFVPWSRYPDDTLDNFVVADQRCNAAKSSSLAAAEHVARWAERFAHASEENAQLMELARRTVWDRRSDRTRNVARAIYLRLTADARLWWRGREFVPPDLAAIGRVFDLPDETDPPHD